MAMNYQNFASLGVNLNRQKYGPLDIPSVFTSEADLNYYLSKGTITEGVSEYWYKNANEKVVPYPYAGQIIATAFENAAVRVFVLTEKADGTFETSNVGDTSVAEAAVAELEEALANAVAAINTKIGEIPTEEKDGEQVPVAENVIDYINKNMAKCIKANKEDKDTLIGLLLVTLAFGFVGFIDDYIKVVKKRLY